MKSLSDNDLISRIKKDNCNDSFIELLDRNKRIYYQICASYCKKVPLKYEDLASDAPFVLNEALKTFKLSKKTKFSTWLYQYSRFFVLKQITNKNKEPQFIDSDVDFEFLNIKNNKFHFDNTNEFKDYVFDILGQLQDKRVKDIFNMRYFEAGDNKWDKIAKKIDLSTMGVILLHDRGLKMLKTKLTGKNIFDKI